MAKTPRRSTSATTTTKGQQPESANQTTSCEPRPSKWSLLLDIRTRRAVYLVMLAAMYSPLSQLVLSPVYGSIPSGVYHKYGIIASAMASFALRGFVPETVDRLIGTFAFWIPTMHFVLFSFSSVMGNPRGPLLTECLTTYPLITVSLYLASKQLDSLDLSFMDSNIAEAAPSMLNYFLFTIFQRLMSNMLPIWMGMNLIFTRLGLQVMIAATYTAIIPQSFLWPSIPTLAFTAIGNVHVPLTRTTEVLQNTLAQYDYSVLDRKDSLTGYISVLQDNKNNFRVLRCDHSLLGGEWIMPADPTGNRKVAEPVYAVFTMLEAVRLVERPKPSGQQKALNIGLGVGTAPSALITHGIRTTIIELDPVVHEFAVNYFGLPQKHIAHFGDAVGIVASTKSEHQAEYDYIIHDVFTGGAEPAELFTYGFLSDLKEILADNGVIAINYAGDLALPTTSLIYRTILEVFPSCRVFREDDQISDDSMDVKDQNGDFTNMVFICNKNSRPVTFRKAAEADFLGSESRRAYMVPKHEVPASSFAREGELLTSANIKTLEKMHVESAIGHWHLMRRVMPATIWENW